MTQVPGNSQEPYCGNCGYPLQGLVESSKCPECGEPLVEVLTRRGPAYYRAGKRFRSRSRLFGLPVIDIAFGPKGSEAKGKARGFIAIGDEATGVLAIGGRARGVVAIGGVAVGLFSVGGAAIGLVTSLGGAAVGGLAAGGGAIGGLASGGGAAGLVAQGGGAVGYFARGGGAFGVHTVGPGSTSPEATAMFDQLSWFFGPWPPSGSLSAMVPIAVASSVPLLLAAIIGLMALWAARRKPPAGRSDAR